jgi:hypothetical protein
MAVARLYALVPLRRYDIYSGFPEQQFLNFLPLPHGHGSFLLGVTGFTTWLSLFRIHFITFAGGRLFFNSFAMYSIYGST